MQYDILQLYQRAQTGTLKAQEVDWLGQQTRDFPYFPLPHLILARHYSLSRDEIAQQQLVTSATYAPNRGLLKSYVMGPVAVAEAPVAGTPVETLVSEAAADAVAAEEKGVASDAAEKKDISESSGSPETTTQEAATPVVEEVGINWFLNTQLRIRSARYEGLTGRLQKQMAKRFEAWKVEAPEDEGKEGDARKEQVRKMEAGPTTFSRKPKTKVVPPAAGEEGALPETDRKEYEIGAFSNFSFLEDQEKPAPEEKEIDSPVAFSPAVAFQSSVDFGKDLCELIFEEEDRILEVTVTQEQLEKYFKGRLPDSAQSGTTSARLEFDFSENQEEDLSEELEGETEISLDAQTEMVSEVADSPENIIDRFIENEPSISRSDAYEGSREDLSARSSSDDNDWVTETLAKIYADQGNHSKAIRIYKKLSLLFPEKSSYFDDQIAKLKR